MPSRSWIGKYIAWPSCPALAARTPWDSRFGRAFAPVRFSGILPGSALATAIALPLASAIVSRSAVAIAIAPPPVPGGGRRVGPSSSCSPSLPLRLRTTGGR